jgi:hypothetical protein
MEPFELDLRARLGRAIAAAPTGPAPIVGRPAVARQHRIRRRRTVLLAFAALLLAGLTAGLPSIGRQDLASRLDDAGVPPGAEIVAVQSRADGTLLTVVYRDAQGVLHTVGGVDRQATPAP